MHSCLSQLPFAPEKNLLGFLADRTIGRAFGTVSRLSVICLSVVCNVLYCGEMVRPS